MPDETAAADAPTTAGDVVATAVESVAKPVARLLGRKGPCADCARRKARIKAVVNRAVGATIGKIRIGKRPR